MKNVSRLMGRLTLFFCTFKTGEAMAASRRSRLIPTHRGITSSPAELLGVMRASAAPQPRTRLKNQKPQHKAQKQAHTSLLLPSGAKTANSGVHHGKRSNAQ
ncbi:hypothetical protein RI103_16225 [Paraburkholderia sp. FT54]|jgi:hypothetical protein|uniref:hypothetical protein n=1 Tax=Paraburkholderia sp. FT54 TaxID=3074437 RepID=UPI0028778D3A|nr:hypothetical protein [Paraburkholderia sp. FT54]WNC89212.1 hypothetical protein RI103_16225 [Paraburkholderia sp. FT54]